MTFAQIEARRRMMDGEPVIIPIRRFTPAPLREEELCARELRIAKVRIAGIVYQQCGGGRRVIRKRVEN